jgi:hypothetical protein
MHGDTDLLTSGTAAQWFARQSISCNKEKIKKRKREEKQQQLF